MPSASIDAMRRFRYFAYRFPHQVLPRMSFKYLTSWADMHDDLKVNLTDQLHKCSFLRSLNISCKSWCRCKCAGVWDESTSRRHITRLDATGMLLRGNPMVLAWNLKCWGCMLKEPKWYFVSTPRQSTQILENPNLPWMYPAMNRQLKNSESRPKVDFVVIIALKYRCCYIQFFDLRLETRSDLRNVFQRRERERESTSGAWRLGSNNFCG